MLTYREISDSVLLCTSSGALVNAVILHHPEGTVVVDSLIRPSDSRELAEKTREFGPVRYLINTHWHSDHCYGNRVVRNESTIGISQEKYWDTIVRERYVLSPNRPYLVDRHNLAKPEIVFSDEYTLDSPIPLRILSTPGHTPDSAVIVLPEEHIVIAGDSVLNSDDGRIGIPYFFWGNIDQHSTATETIGDLKPDLILSGHGLPVNREKIMLDGIYLDSLKGLFEDFIHSIPRGTLTEMSTKALQAIPATDCLPGTRPEDFWVPRMHELNLERLLRDYLNMGDE